jgi:ATP-dependent RNA helicase HelY
LANNKTRQARECLLNLLKGQEPLPLEVVYSSCGCDFDALAGALSSLIEKEEVRIGRLKTRSGWLIGENGNPSPNGGATWHTGRSQMKLTLPRLLRELKKYAPPEGLSPAGEDADEELTAVEELLSDGLPRSRPEITAATGFENIPPPVWRHFSQLPDGRFTLPDSEGAWNCLLDYVREKPRRLSDLLRLFRRHKKITARLATGNDREPFVRLPRSLITTTDSPEGRSELEKRRQVKLCRDALESLPRPFFIPEELGLNQKELRGLADSYAVNVEFAGKKYLCLRREFPGEVLVEQLGEISGRYFAPPHAASAPAFLKEHSLGEREAASVLGLAEDALAQLSNSGEAGHFILDDRPRFWRSDVEDLKKDGARLRELAKEYERLNVPEAAALLGITTGQVRRLIDEGVIIPVLNYETRRGAGHLLRRGDLERLRGSLDAGMSRWTPVKEREPGEDLRNPAHLPARKKPPRREDTPPPATENLVLDDFQISAAQALQEGKSVLVAAPTGNGKTLVAEMLAKDLMAAGRGMVYTSPLKALSNQKYRDFKDIFGEEAVGLVTGDISINPGAPMLIMTTEIFRNWCLSEPAQLEKIFYVVFDEIHYLDDAERGTTWEESILFAPPHIRILGLSATVPNVQEIANWIASVRGEEVTVIQENRRHVPLAIRWVLPNGRIVQESEARNEVEDLTEYLKALRNKKRWIEE